MRILLRRHLSIVIARDFQAIEERDKFYAVRELQGPVISHVSPPDYSLSIGQTSMRATAWLLTMKGFGMVLDYFDIFMTRLLPSWTLNLAHPFPRDSAEMSITDGDEAKPLVGSYTPCTIYHDCLAIRGVDEVDQEDEVRWIGGSWKFDRRLLPQYQVAQRSLFKMSAIEALYKS